jgi:pimeloyl-ACP methyl ester carboxylesterase
MGSLIALEAAALAQKRADNLVLVGTAFPMAVSDVLLSYAKDNKPEAIDILTYMGYSYPARLGRNTNPGIWMTGSTKKLLEKSGKGVIYQDLKACAEYRSGLESAKKVSAKTLLILGKKDFLTPPLKANDLIKSFNNPVVKEIADSGHTLMIESPNTILDYLIEAL